MRKDWISDNLSNCIKLKSGDGLTAKKMMPGDFPVFGGNGIAGYHNDFNLTGEHIIIGRVGALCGNTRYVNDKIWFTDNAFRISEFKYDFDLEFLNYLLNHIDLRSYARQAAQPVISNSSLKNVNLSFPKSLSEQEQIVGILDEAFTAIDQAKANTEKNIQNSKELFQSKLNDIFNQNGDGWEEKTLGDVCVKTKNIKWQDYSNEEFEYIDLSSVSRETLNVTGTATVNKGNAPSRAKKIVMEGDVIFATTRPTLKRATIIDSDLDGQICSTGYVVLRPKENISPDWIFFYLLTSTFMDRMESLQRGASYPAVTDSDVKGSILSVPLSKELEKMSVKRMNELRVNTNDLILQYQKKLSDLEELKKAILQKAFSGELTNKEVEV